MYYKYVFEHMTHLYVLGLSFIRNIYLNIFRIYMMSDVAYSYIIYSKMYYEYTGVRNLFAKSFVHVLRMIFLFCVTWLIYMYENSRPYVIYRKMYYEYTWVSVLWIYMGQWFMCKITPLRVSHDPFSCVAWLIHMYKARHVTRTNESGL